MWFGKRGSMGVMLRAMNGTRIEGKKDKKDQQGMYVCVYVCVPGWVKSEQCQVYVSVQSMQVPRLPVYDVMGWIK